MQRCGRHPAPVEFDQVARDPQHVALVLDREHRPFAGGHDAALHRRLLGQPHRHRAAVEFGPWVLAIGLMRYANGAAEWVLPWRPPRHSAHWVLRDVSFRIRAGEKVALIGR